MILRKLAVPLLALLAALSQAPRAAAQSEGDLARARELFVEGSTLAEAGKWEQARDRFERSIKLKHAALTAYNLGVASQETGHLVAAVESFRDFLAQPVEPATQRYVEPVRAALAQLEGRLGRLEIEIRPAGLRGLVLRLDGRVVSPASGPWPLDPGRHEIVAVAPGYREVRHTTSAAEGTRATLALWLAPVEGPAPSLVLPTALALGGLAMFVGGELVFGVGAHQAAGAPLDTGSGRTAMVAGNVVEGLGVLAAGAGVVLLFARMPARLKSAAVVPWSAGSVAGVEVRVP